MLNNKKTIKCTYKVAGRYMSGSSVVGYHLVGSDGIQIRVNKERLIYLIGKGLVDNMRVQAYKNQLIIRGKGINLNNLPVYDINKDKFRDSNNKVGADRDSCIKDIGQMEIVKRIMYKTKCLGYVVRDFRGIERKLSRAKVIDLAMKRLIKNATVQKYNDKNTGVTKLILRGLNCDLTKLPILIVDSTGKIIDPEDKRSVRMRATRVKRAGAIHDKIKNITIPFKAGDYLVCGFKGVIRAVKSNEMDDLFIIDKETKYATCDNYLNNLKRYPIEIFGKDLIELNKNQILKWSIVKPK